VESSSVLAAQVRELEHRITVASTRTRVGLALVALLGVVLIAGNDWNAPVRLTIGLGLFTGAVLTLGFLLQLGDLAHRTRELTATLARGLESVAAPLPADSGAITVPVPASLEEHALAVYNRVRKEIERRSRVSEDLDRRAFEASTLYDLMLRMSADLKLETALKMALYSSMGVFGVTEGILLLAEPDGALVAATVRVMHEPPGPGPVAFPADPERRAALSELSQPIPFAVLARRPPLVAFATQLTDAFPGFLPEVACPLANQGQFVGLMLLGARITREPYSAENFRFFDTIAPAVALVIKNARMVDSLEESNRALDRKVGELELLNEISRNLNVVGDLGDVLATVLELSARGVDASGGAVHLFDPATGGLHRAALCGPLPPLAGAVPIPLGTGLLGSVGQSLKALLVGPGHPFGPEELGFASGSEIQSILSVPLTLERRLVGLLTMVNKTGGRPFTDSDLTWMQTVANHTASVMENLRLFKLATEDGLTGLYVHRYFQIRLREELSRSARNGRPVSLLLADIDHFKQVNDLHGHQTGDVVLREVAKALRANLRDVDVPARYGGEEMAVILPETDSAGALVVAERIRSAIESHPTSNIIITVSIGVSTVASPDNSRAARDALDALARDLIERADQALYAAKRAGRNRVTVAA